MGKQNREERCPHVEKNKHCHSRYYPLTNGKMQKIEGCLEDCPKIDTSKTPEKSSLGRIESRFTFLARRKFCNLTFPVEFKHFLTHDYLFTCPKIYIEEGFFIDTGVFPIKATQYLYFKNNVEKILTIMKNDVDIVNNYNIYSIQLACNYEGLLYAIYSFLDSIGFFMNIITNCGCKLEIRNGKECAYKNFKDSHYFRIKNNNITSKNQHVQNYIKGLIKCDWLISLYNERNELSHNKTLQPKYIIDRGNVKIYIDPYDYTYYFKSNYNLTFEERFLYYSNSFESYIEQLRILDKALAPFKYDK